MAPFYFGTTLVKANLQSLLTPPSATYWLSSLYPSQQPTEFEKLKIDASGQSDPFTTRVCNAEDLQRSNSISYFHSRFH